jgi:cytochrome c
MFNLTSSTWRIATTTIALITISVFATVPGMALADQAHDAPAIYGFGTPSTAEEIAAWDIDVRPDGKGLPAGQGSAVEGSKIYAVKCVACHGIDGAGGINERLVVHSADEPFPDSNDPNTRDHRTVGNYWPYATTLFDYIRRSMPFNMPGSLDSNEVYALTAHLLYLNHIIPEDAEMNAETLPKVEMPARDSFVLDDRQNYREVH